MSVRGLSVLQPRKQGDCLCSPASSVSVSAMHPQQRGPLSVQRVSTGVVPVTPGEADTRLRAALDVLSGIHGRACFAKRRTVEEHGLQPAYQNLTFQNSLRVF